MLPPTVVIELDAGERTLRIEQVADLGSLAVASVVAHDPGPYWAYLWPSARALARFLATEDELVGKRLLDLGCGLGALAAVAAGRGATVVAADLRPEAIELTQRNAALNALALDARVVDWNAPPPDLGTFDRIVAADVFYEDGMLSAILRFTKKHLAPDGTAHFADPMRVVPSGIAGAARFHGFETTSTVLVEGTTVSGGVTLHTVRRRRRR